MFPALLPKYNLHFLPGAAVPRPATGQTVLQEWCQCGQVPGWPTRTCQGGSHASRHKRPACACTQSACLSFSVACSGVAGDEDGYVVAMTDGEPSPPYVLQPGTRVRLVSDYSASERRLGAGSPCVLLFPPEGTHSTAKASMLHGACVLFCEGTLLVMHVS